MIAKIKRLVMVFLVGAALATPALVPAVVSADDIQDPLCGGTNFTFTNGTCTDLGETDDNASNLIKAIINILSVIVGVIAVVMIIFGGLKYITSNGESSNITSAKNTIIFAIVGLVIVALAQFIVRFVLNKAIKSTTEGSFLFPLF
jgi:cytochrome bd-type quinol oxidase subunit 2